MVSITVKAGMADITTTLSPESPSSCSRVHGENGRYGGEGRGESREQSIVFFHTQ